jgi:hypothetical protein
MVKASVGNVATCAMLDEREGKYWTSAPLVDVQNVLEELDDRGEKLRRAQAKLKEIQAIVTVAIAQGEDISALKILETISG